MYPSAPRFLFHRALLLLLGVALGCASPCLCLGQAQVLSPTNSLWAYRKGTAEATTPPEAWRQPGFDDAAWARGDAPFYYDTDSVYTGATHLPDMRGSYTSVFLRHTFQATGVADLATLRIRFFCDDGFVLWLNGSVLTSFNKSPGDVGFSSLASASIAEPLEWREHALTQPQRWLVEGTNLLAAQVFNSSRTSSDFVFEVEVSARAPDTAPPGIAEVHPPAGTVEELTSITVVFTEPVQGVGFSDLLVNQRPASAVSGGGTTYTFAIDPPAPGPVEVSWDAGAGIVDLGDPPNRFDVTSPGAGWTYQRVDRTVPGMSAVHPIPENTIRALSQIEVFFSEPVTGVDAGDLWVGGRPAAAVSGSGAGPYRFEFLEPGPGNVPVTWVPGHGIRDLAEPANAFAGGTWSYRVDPSLVQHPVRISEIVTGYSGDAGLRDEDDDVQDWIELENTGATEVQLRGWSLSDDPGDPGKWVFPDVRVGPGGFLVIHASAKDRRPAQPGRLHTNFKLGSEGEYLGLFDAESPRAEIAAFTPAYPVQRNDVSFGFDPEGRLRHFALPTPGDRNAVSGIDGVLSPVDFNVGRGVFERPFDLHLSSSSSGAEIRYTMDGSDPGAAGAMRYTGPLRVAGTTVVRAAAFQPGRLPSAGVTHTYVFPAGVARQPANPPGVPAQWIDTQGRAWTADYGMDPEIIDAPAYRDRIVPSLKALPVLSIVARPADMFDNATGIYPKSQARGPSWERPASAEIIDWERGESVQANCGVQMQGNSVRDPVKTGKHAFRLVFKGDYGPAKLRYRVFPDGPLEEFDTLTLRADFNNSWMHWNGAQRPRGQRVRDAWTKESQRAMGGLASRSRFFHLYVNGLYWGVYDAVERPDAAFAAAYLGGGKEDFDVVNEGQLVDGSMAAYNAMRSLTGLDTPAEYERMKGYLDVPAYIDYLLLHFYVGHEDWFTDKNWYATRRRAPGAGFRYHSWDGELILNSPAQNIVTRTDQPSGLHTKLLASAQYRLDFADRVQRHLFGDGALAPAAAAARYDRWATLVEPAMVAESARWGDYRRDVHAYQSGPYELYTVDGHFRAERQRLMNQFFPGRTATLLGQLKAAGLYPAQAVAPVFGLPAGRVPPGSRLTLVVPGGGGGSILHFTTDGSDPRVRFTGAVSVGARLYSTPLTIDATTLVRVRSRMGSEWSALAEARYDVGVPGLPLAITEVHYHPSGGDPYEFVEVRNEGPLTLDVGGFSLEGVSYVFPQGSVLEPGRIVVLASALSPGSFETRHPGLAVFGWFGGSLSDSGERLALLHRDGATVVSVDYRDRDGWPREADGNGPSLERIDAAGDPDAAGTWRASAVPEGTPGVVAGAGDGPGAVRLSEVYAASGPGESDWVEVDNAGAVEVDLGGWSLTDDDNPRRFVFPPGTRVPAGGWLVVACVGPTASGSVAGGSLPARLEAGFALEAGGGETIVLHDPAGASVDALSFGRQVKGYSLSRIGDDDDVEGTNIGAWRLGAMTPGAENLAAPTAESTALVINEWLADPSPGEDDWIELYNRDPARPVALRGWVLGTATATHRIGVHAFVGPGAHLVLRADEEQGPNHVDFRLPAAAGSIVLHAPSGELVERVDYGLQTEGVTQGRLPDGAASIESFPRTPSPGGLNHAPEYRGPRLNEILAWDDSDTGSGSSSGVGWVELRHDGEALFDLGGMALAPARGGSLPWTFPAGSVLEPGAHGIVVFDPWRPAGADGARRWNTGQSLPRDGGGVYLLEADGRVADSVEFGFQVGSMSIGWTAAGWRLMLEPTPGSGNAAPAALGRVDELRINEWLAAASAGDDWVELHNRGSGVVALAGLELGDHPGLSGRRPWEFAPLSFIGPEGFVRVRADGSSGEGPARAGFQLAASGEALVLTDGAGRTLDAVYFGRQTVDVSQGRLPDGADGPFELFPRPTPGRGNATPGLSPPVLELLRVDGAGVRIRIRGDAGVEYRLESSRDLNSKLWLERRRDRPGSTSYEVVLPVEAGEGWEFFRVGVAP